MKIAIFHENFAQRGGAERVTEALHRLLPQADLLSTFTANDILSPYLKQAKPKNTWMQILPAKRKLYRFYFLFYPFAIEGVDLSAYDLVLTSCYGHAKGVKRKPGALHICYCHNPMRWVWQFPEYVARANLSQLEKWLLSIFIRLLKAWEIRAAGRPDFFIANSNIVSQRLLANFGIDSTVIQPPVDTMRFAPAESIDDYYLVLTRLLPHKRIDLAIEGCSRLNRRLLIIGEGPDRSRLEAMAGPSVSFLGHLPDAAVNSYAARCRALILPGEEDFGLTPLEVNSAGRPVIAFRGGGALETIVENLNGVFFDEPNTTSLMQTILRFESMEWNSVMIRRHAEQWDVTVFQKLILAFLQAHVPEDLSRTLKQEAAEA